MLREANFVRNKILERWLERISKSSEVSKSARAESRRTVYILFMTNFYEREPGIGGNIRTAKTDDVFLYSLNSPKPKTKYFSRGNSGEITSFRRL